MKAADAAEARERLLDAAERLFARKGFAATTLRDVSSALGITHAALYYHFPGGKEELFAAVMERHALRHGAGLAAAIGAGAGDLRAQLRGIAAWLLSQPPIDLIRMAETDMPALPEPAARRVMEAVYRELIVRVRDAFAQAAAAGRIEKSTDAGLVGGAFIGMVESLHSVPAFAVKGSREAMADELTEIILKGIGYELRRKG